jgi:hypothetical protein
MRDYTHYELLQQGAEGIDIVCGNVPDDTPPDTPLSADDDDYAVGPVDLWGGPNDAPCAPAQTYWTRLVVGSDSTTVLHVSSGGQFRLEGAPFYAITPGLPQTGSPYKVLNVEVAPHTYRTYYAHDLVWRAFHGRVPQGYEVRHVNHVFDDNRLDNLDLYPAVAQPIDF